MNSVENFSTETFVSRVPVPVVTNSNKLTKRMIIKRSFTYKQITTCELERLNMCNIEAQYSHDVCNKNRLNWPFIIASNCDYC